MQLRIFLVGFAGWAVATAALRAGGEHILRSGDWPTILVLYAASFPLMFFLARAVCGAGATGDRVSAALSLALPMLLLDPFSSAFFGVVFPNIPAQMAGVFGGWMLWCCAGLFLGALVRPRVPA